MAPPKVDLSSKEAQKKMEEAGETKVPLEADVPPVVAAGGARPQCRRGKRHCALMLVFLLAVAIVIVAIAFTFKFVLRHRRPHEMDCRVVLPAGKVPEHVKVDEANKLISVRTPVPNSDYHAVHALHDYNSNFIAFKDVTKMRCYIDRIVNTTFERDYDRWAGRQNGEHQAEPRFLKATDPIKDEGMLEQFAGRHIDAHCHGVETRWVVAVSKEEAANGNWEESEHVVRMVYTYDLKIRIDIKTQKKK